jgi:hypothetical protein
MKRAFCFWMVVALFSFFTSSYAELFVLGEGTFVVDGVTHTEKLIYDDAKGLVW